MGFYGLVMGMARRPKRPKSSKRPKRPSGGGWGFWVCPCSGAPGLRVSKQFQEGCAMRTEPPWTRRPWRGHGFCGHLQLLDISKARQNIVAIFCCFYFDFHRIFVKIIF